IAASVVALMLLLWYRPPFFSALDGRNVLLILLGVDITLGPLFTLIIFNPRKSRRALTFDLSIIAILQISALMYGMSVVFAARPVYVVFSKNSFDLVTANMLLKDDIAKAANPEFRSLPLTGPVYVYSEMPANIKERNEVSWAAFSSGKDLPEFPQYYQPYEEHMQVAGRAARPISELKKFNPGRIADIDTAIHASGRAESDVGYLPLRAKYHDEAVLVGISDGRVLAQLNVKPWPPTAKPSSDKK
ncbi:MAG: TfpX/TfpZ family type IV pilin accessory protein, partial [Gallionella sp.]